MPRRIAGPLLWVAVGLSCCVLSFYQVTALAQRPVKPTQPFANAVGQRMEMIRELGAIRELLKEQNMLLKEQNDLLRVTKPGKPPGRSK